MLDLGKLMFGGSVVTGFLPGAHVSGQRIAFGLLATLLAGMIGLIIIPREK